MWGKEKVGIRGERRLISWSSLRMRMRTKFAKFQIHSELDSSFIKNWVTAQDISLTSTFNPWMGMRNIKSLKFQFHSFLRPGFFSVKLKAGPSQNSGQREGSMPMTNLLFLATSKISNPRSFSILAFELVEANHPADFDRQTRTKTQVHI